MKRLIMNRWFLTVMGVLALALLVWFVGDAIAIFDYRPLEAAWVRGVVILLIVLVYAAKEVFQFIRARQTNRKLLDEIASSGKADDGANSRSSEEVEKLRGRFEQALKTLKKTKFKNDGGNRQYLYQLPWYMFIGAPGSGKTTALARSGLRFPLGADGQVDAVKGVGGTRNCDWWFTDEAVFLDTAGRYTTQDSEQRVDAASWRGFLSLLKKFRPRSPLNGAIVTLSMADLLMQSEEERVKYAIAVRQRVAELHEKLGTRFPIYLLLTKSDLMAGFSEFFADMGHDDREQVWGITFPYDPAVSETACYSRQFLPGFEALVKRLNSRLTDRLLAERDAKRRALVFAFPQQFSLVGPLVQHFIEQAFEVSKFSQQALLRGVYFTSGTQEGAPLDRVLGSLSRTLKLERKIIPPSAASGKSFFLTRLLREVVFSEAALAGFDEGRERRNKWVMRGSMGLLAFCSLLTLGLWGLSYVRNQQLIADTNAKLAALRAETDRLPSAKAEDLPGMLGYLNDVRELPFGYAERQRPIPLTMRFGLFQGDKIGEQSVSVYRRLLRDSFLPRIALRLEEQLRQERSNQILYEALKTYLMLYDGKHLDPDAVETWVLADWGPRLARLDDRDAKKDLADHVKAGLQGHPPEISVPIDNDLVTDVRRRLAAGSLPERVYERMKLMGVGDDVPPFNLAEVAGAQSVQALQRGSGEAFSAPFPALYTREGYQKMKAQAEKIVGQLALEENWVLGNKAGSNVLKAAEVFVDVKRRYLEDYIRTWDGFLNDIQVKPSHSLADTLLYVRILSATDSPLKRIALAASKQTSLGSESGAMDKAKEIANDDAIDHAKQFVGRLFGSQAANVLPTESARPEMLVDQHFENLRQLAGSGAAGQPAPIDTVIARLADVYQELSAQDGALRVGSAQFQGLASVTRLKAEAERLPVPFAGIIKSLLGTVSKQTAEANEKSLQSGLGGASAFCEKAIRGRYPFVRGAQAEVSVEDFSAIFATGGDLDKYFQANLVNFVDRSGDPWRVRAGGDGGASISPATLRQFQNADTIRQAFFRSAAAAVTAELALATAEAGEVTLEYDGETQRLSPGAGAIRVQWPARKPGAMARLSTADGGQTVSAEGSWALFRLFDKGQPERAGQADKMRLSYNINGKKLVIDLRAMSVLNAFRLRELQSFQCPGR